MSCDYTNHDSDNYWGCDAPPDPAQPSPVGQIHETVAQIHETTGFTDIDAAGVPNFPEPEQSKENFNAGDMGLIEYFEKAGEQWKTN